MKNPLANQVEVPDTVSDEASVVTWVMAYIRNIQSFSRDHSDMTPLDMSRALYESKTLPLYNQLKGSVLKKYVTLDLPFKFGAYYSFAFVHPEVLELTLFPYHFTRSYKLERNLRGYDILQFLDRNSNLIEALQHFWAYWAHTPRNLPLTEGQVSILQYFARFQRGRFLPLQTMANGLDMNYRTFRGHYQQLYAMGCLSQTYKVVTPQLGYRTLCVLHGNDLVLDDTLPHYCLVDAPLAMMNTKPFQNVKLKIFQIPDARHAIFGQVHQDLQPFVSLELDFYSRGNNLHHLWPNPSDRWRSPPPILTYDVNWGHGISWKNNGACEFSLTPNPDPPSLTRAHTQVLSWFHVLDITKDTQLARQIGVNKNTLTQVWADLERLKLIRPISIMRNIGLLFLFITIYSQKSSHFDLFQKISGHLQTFPFTELYRGFNSENHMICGIIGINADWLRYLDDKLNKLRNLGIMVTYSVVSSQYQLKRNVDVHTTYFGNNSVA